MMDANNQILQRVNSVLISTKCLVAKRLRHSGTTADPVSKVLDDGDLLIELLVHLGFPTTLIHASLVCKRWFHHASEPAFLRRFRKLHPPRLLGFYINTTWSNLEPISFVPMLPQPPEIASVIRRASSILDTSLDTYKNRHPYVVDCLKGNVSIRLVCYASESRSVVYNPLFPERGMTIVPPIPHHPSLSSAIERCHLLLKEEGAGLSFSYGVAVSSTRNKESVVHVYMLQAGVWCKRTSATTVVPCEQLQEPLLIDNKIYILTSLSGILVLDLTTSIFSTIQLPYGVVCGEHSFRIHPSGLHCSGRTMLSRGDNDYGVYLIHVSELQLAMWLHKGGSWLLVDTICLREMCGGLNMSDCVLMDGHIGFVEITKVGANAEFVLLKTPRIIFYWDVKCKAVHKVYEVTKKGYRLCDIHPFMMIWPPIFPTLKDDTAREGFPLAFCVMLVQLLLCVISVELLYLIIVQQKDSYYLYYTEG